MASSPKRTSKRSRTAKLIPAVVDILSESDALPSDLRTLLQLTLPTVLDVNKADRSGYEGEVVDQAQQALAAVQATLEQAHAAALKKQNEVIAPAEHSRRAFAKQAAEACLEAAKAKLEACRDAKNAGHKNVHDAQVALKASEKEAAAVDKDMQTLVDKKAALSDMLATEFTLLREGSSAGAAGKKAVQRLEKLGKEHGLDCALLHSFPISCKKPAAARTDFQNLMFTSLQTAFNRQIDDLTQKLAEAEPAKAQKLSAVAGAKDALAQAEAELTGATENLATAQAAQKESTKEVGKANESMYSIWTDMKTVCDAQDELTNDLKNFTENVLPAFQQLKEKEPEPEPVEALEPMVEETPAAEAAPEAAEMPAEAEAVAAA